MGEGMFSQRIREVMHREQLIVAGPDTTVSEAARTMADSGTSAVVVLE
ncbi:MAG: CBS domain-containing protein, partial [Burkholderiales bacterium]|nr:CBS domain-containing protein [Burkholderiales bacterium]